MSQLTDRFNKLWTSYAHTAGYDKDLWRPILTGIDKLEQMPVAIAELIASARRQNIPDAEILKLVEAALKEMET